MNLLRPALTLGAIALCAACAHAPSAPRNPLPPMTLPRFPDWTPVSLDAERGNVLVLDFWATWCEPCKAALPEWEAFAQAYRGRGVRLYAVSVDGDPNKIAEFLKEVKLDVPVLLDRDAAVAEGMLHMQIVPTVYIVDKSGGIRSVHQGYAPGDVKSFIKEIDPLLTER